MIFQLCLIDVLEGKQSTVYSGSAKTAYREQKTANFYNF